MKMSQNEQLVPIKSKWNGFLNILFIELNDWWKGSDWLVMTLIWIGIGNGITALTALGAPDIDLPTMINIFFLFLGFFPPIATILVMQDSIVGEKRSGTISWLLSKPVSRRSFILAKWLGNSINLLTCIVLIPCIIGYLEFFLLTGELLSLSNYLAGIGIVTINQLFFIGLTLYLGTVMETPGGVAALPMIFNFAQQFLQSIPYAIYVLPMSLILNQTGNSIVVSIILNQTPFTLIPILTTSLFVILFLLLAIWKFENTDL
ncbi:MAG: ABC transporter permease subunit [Candidatus Lokiarchaeota archaeon]|nr:ABC transporter permease subunit [Candidatus Lokiarchaeota archaeon]MBD3200961.1 ABC transporter permease subunit [Candidatus Lokiarchaeota archaeon]